MGNQEEILEGLKNSVIDYDQDKAKVYAIRAVNDGMDAQKAITDGLSAGMSEVGQRYEKQDMYLPEVMAASQAMYAALNILMPHLSAKDDTKVMKKVVIGTVEGDVHSIGKTIVGTLLKVHGYDVQDLGADVPINTFIETAEKSQADVIAMSTLMTTTMAGMEDAMKSLKAKGIRDKFKVAVGGAPVNEEFCRLIGADFTATNAEKAVEEANRVFGGE
ncbi:cobalamin B12-binding domain-containing protein [Methanomassiliicoccus luminyensis]|uniref:cobalamin B12-binding domain-containing protein n=1 Tax=Methanomassiliicoccus luminyensis TaxID=1080712 RepID=UPI00036750FD|nr:corrinoid protein [Methanomassiliicoccus luminyensis]